MPLRKRIADWVICISAAALVVASFLEWFSAAPANTIIVTPGDPLADELNRAAGEVSVNGWSLDAWYVWTLPPVATALVMVAVVVIRVWSPQSRVGLMAVDLGALGLLAVAFIAIKLVMGEDITEGKFLDEVLDFTTRRATGIYIALASTIGLAVGGFLQPFRSSREGPSGPEENATIQD